jgi:hypothetical protein
VVVRFFSQFLVSPAITIPLMLRIYLHFNTPLARVKNRLRLRDSENKCFIFFFEVGKQSTEKSLEPKELSLVSEHLMSSNGLALPVTVKCCRHPWKASLFPGTFYLGSAVDKATVELACQHVDCAVSMIILLRIVSTYGLWKARVPAVSVSDAPFSADSSTLQRLLSKKATDLSGSSYKTIQLPLFQLQHFSRTFSLP